jgi:hypothetical protein
MHRNVDNKIAKVVGTQLRDTIDPVCVRMAGKLPRDSRGGLAIGPAD